MDPAASRFAWASYGRGSTLADSKPGDRVLSDDVSAFAAEHLTDNRSLDNHDIIRFVAAELTAARLLVARDTALGPDGIPKGALCATVPAWDLLFLDFPNFRLPWGIVARPWTFGSVLLFMKPGLACREVQPQETES